MLRSKPATITTVTSTTCHRLIQSKSPTARGYNKKLSAPLWGACALRGRLGHHEGSWPDSYAPDSDDRACYRQLRRIPLLETVRKGFPRELLGTLPSMRKAYQTDLSDAEWSYIEPHVPTPRAPGRPRLHTPREILDAIFYVVRSGCAWRL